MKRILVFETALSGHRLEYIHHLYMKGVEDCGNMYYFVLPDSFNQIKLKSEWPKANNIIFDLMSQSSLHRCENSNQIYRAYKKTSLLLEYKRKWNADVAILIMLMDFAPFVSFVNWGDTKIRGIIYKVYLHEQKGMNMFRKLLNQLVYYLFAKRKSFEWLYVLNDKKGESELNKLFRSDKFRYLPDPVPCINENSVLSIRNELGASETDKVFLQFGELTERKGTLDILKAAELNDSEKLSHVVIVFAGVVKEEIRESFYFKVKSLSGKVRIVVYDEFCPYELLYKLCKSCDVVLVPYHFVNLSSGVIGYAALFGKPVIGPSQGVLGNLISSNMLGVTLDDVSAEGLKDIFQMTIPDVTNAYCQTHTIKNFVDAIL